jgi:hypothetical protein
MSDDNPVLLEFARARRLLGPENLMVKFLQTDSREYVRETLAERKRVLVSGSAQDIAQFEVRGGGGTFCPVQVAEQSVYWDDFMSRERSLPTGQQ